jgi:pimeloyl-ACP methyl ester carboxylesterase
MRRDIAKAGTKEFLVFAGATAVVVIHVLLDAFVLVEPGASRQEHLLPGLVSVAVAVAAVALYRVMWPGLRALVALVFGVFALVRAGVAISDLSDGDPTRDDWSALVLIPAGVALCALGGWVLWTSRKPGRWRWARRAGIAVATALAVYWVLFPAAYGIVATEKPRTAAEPADLGRPHEDVTVRTSDGLELVGWYVPSQNGAAVIAFPGRHGPVEHARMLARHGYGVLLLDMRGQGKSEGDPNAFGWESAKDLDAAVAFLKQRPDVEDGRIGGLGLSVGGELMIETAASNPDLRAVISEGAGERSVRESLLLGAQGWFSVPTIAVQTGSVAFLSNDAPPPALDDLAAAIAPRPLFLIYGSEGQGAEKELNPRYFEAAGEPKLLWEVPAAGHTGGIDTRPRDYEQRVVQFFDEALLDSASSSARTAG